MAIPIKVLLTGFEPFGGEPINPSLEVVQRLHGRRIADAVVCGAKLSVAFHTTYTQVTRAIERVRPDVVLGLGLAVSRNTLAVERVALNLRDGGPDNKGLRVVDEPVVQDGPAAYFATVPVKEILKQLNENAIPARLSNSAGTYCCNEMMYAALHHAATNGLDIACGFIHVPRLPQQDVRRAGSSSMPLVTMIRGVEIAIHVCVGAVLRGPRRDLYVRNATDALLKAPLLYS